MESADTGGAVCVMVAHLAVRDVRSDRSRQTGTFTGTCTTLMSQVNQQALQ